MHVCLFDIDGTLVHTGGAGKASLYEALRTGFNVTRSSDGVAIHGRTDRGITEDLFRHHGIENHPANWDKFRSEYLRHLPELMGRLNGCVLPGIVSMLDRLRTRDDVVLGLLTGNTQAGAQTKLRHYQLDHYFEFGGFGDDHPDRIDVARAALDEAHRRAPGKVQLDRVWVIGDTPGDVRCGRAIGAKVIAVATGDSSHEELAATNPDHLARDFADYEPVWALWE